MLSTMIESEAQLTVGIRTWPRAHLSQRTLSDLQSRIQLERAIKLGRQNLENADAIGEAESQSLHSNCRRITQKLLKALEAIRDAKNEQLLARAGRKPRREAAKAAAEPHFGSMILYGTLQRDEGKALQRGMALRREMRGAPLRRKSISILSDDVPTEEGEPEEGEAEVAKVLPEQLAQLEAQEEPVLLQLCPLLTSLFCAGLLLFLGALFFRTIDSEMASQPFHRALLFAFQAVGTIGWGDVRASNLWSQAFCSLYTIFGVPVFFSSLANLGRFISEFYTIDWLFLTCVVRPTGGNQQQQQQQQQQLSLRKSVYLLCIHQLVGLLLYGGLLKEHSPVAVLYFCLTSMATIGIGDIHPDATNLGEALVAIVFMSVGMILLFALLITLAYHFQTLFFVRLRNWLQRKAEERK